MSLCRCCVGSRSESAGLAKILPKVHGYPNLRWSTFYGLRLVILCSACRVVSRRDTPIKRYSKLRNGDAVVAMAVLVAPLVRKRFFAATCIPCLRDGLEWGPSIILTAYVRADARPATGGAKSLIALLTFVECFHVVRSRQERVCELSDAPGSLAIGLSLFGTHGFTRMPTGSSEFRCDPHSIK